MKNEPLLFWVGLSIIPEQMGVFSLDSFSLVLYHQWYSLVVLEVHVCLMVCGIQTPATWQ